VGSRACCLELLAVAAAIGSSCSTPGLSAQGASIQSGHGPPRPGCGEMGSVVGHGGGYGGQGTTTTAAVTGIAYPCGDGAPGAGVSSASMPATPGGGCSPPCAPGYETSASRAESRITLAGSPGRRAARAAAADRAGAR
jgi:hypothetical protein